MLSFKGNLISTLIKKVIKSIYSKNFTSVLIDLYEKVGEFELLIIVIETIICVKEICSLYQF